MKNIFLDKCLSLDQDECKPNPCRHNATCIDLVADFNCQCVSPWIGRLCNLRMYKYKK